MNESLVADASGRTIILGRDDNERRHDALLVAGFEAQAHRNIVDVVRDSANRTQDTVQSTAALTQAAIFKTEATVQTTAAATNLAIEKTAAASQLLASQLASQALVEAVKNQAATQAALAACCCEIKELTRAEGAQTRSLIEANRAADLVASLTAAQNEINLLKIRFPVIPV